jgi:cell division protease FtsH
MSADAGSSPEGFATRFSQFMDWCRAQSFTEGDARSVVMVFSQDGPPGPEVRVEVISTEPDHGTATLAELRRLMVEHNVYRDQVVSLGNADMRRGMPGLGVSFHALPRLSRGDIVLAEGVLERIERHTIGMARHREALLAGGRHLKRGLLLYGPPGASWSCAPAGLTLEDAAPAP